MIIQESLFIETPGRGMLDITAQVAHILQQAKMKTGLCQVFLHHTSASLVLCENADTDVQKDLERFMQRLVPDGDPLFHHTAEGPDDMSAHVRTILTRNDLTLPITNSQLALGAWQGIYLWEQRLAANKRRATVTLIGE